LKLYNRLVDVFTPNKYFFRWVINRSKISGSPEQIFIINVFIIIAVIIHTILTSPNTRFTIVISTINIGNLIFCVHRINEMYKQHKLKNWKILSKD